MQKANELVNWIVNLVFYPILVVILTVMILFACGVKPYITMSGSMEPEIRTGSICFVNTKAEYDEMREGDIVAYSTSSGSLVTHRVIAVTLEGLETKGDNNEVSDGISTTSANFHGETLFSIPYVGYGLKALQQPRNFAVVIVIIGGIFLYNVIDSYWARKDEK